MTLHNAFGELALDSTLADLLAAVAKEATLANVAKEATLAQMSTDVAKNSVLESVRDTVALNSTLVSLRDGYGTSILTRKVLDGKFFIAGAAITLGGVASSDRAFFQIRNPADSGKLLLVVALTLYSTVTMQVQYTEDATAVTPTTIAARNVNRASPNAASSVISHSTSPPTGGSAWPNQSRVSADRPLELTLPPIVLPPGKSLGVLGTSSAAQTLTSNVYFIEEPLA